MPIPDRTRLALIGSISALRVYEEISVVASSFFDLHYHICAGGPVEAFSTLAV